MNVRISAMCGEVPDGRCLIQASTPPFPAANSRTANSSLPLSLGKGTSFPRSPGAARSSCLKQHSRRLIGGYIEKGFPLYFINDQLLGYLGYSSYEDFVEDTGGMVENGIHPGDRDRVNTLSMSR